MVDLKDEYLRQHEEITDIEFEIMNLSTAKDPDSLRVKIDDLKDKHDRHIGFEEQHLLPLLEDKVSKETISYVKEEHVELIKRIKELKELVNEDYDKEKVLEKISTLRGLHTSHIRAEANHFYPHLEEIDKDRTAEIMKKYQNQEFNDYEPLEM